jgi:mannose-6-phosphate isomerase-like protein (cupin superfamily)
VETHVHSFEESFYVLEGRIRVTSHGETREFGPDYCGVIPVGIAHSIANSADVEAKWIEMVAPRPRGLTEPADTFFIRGEEADGAPGRVLAGSAVRDPRARHFFRLLPEEMDVAALQRGSDAEAETVSASMATALLVYSGITVKMLVDQRLGAQLLTMFMVEYQPGGVAHPHDHPFEEAYLILEGEIEAVADGRRYTLRPRDVFWTGVGSVHAFYNTSNANVRWLETQAPQPPTQHSYRFDRDWEYLTRILTKETPRTPPTRTADASASEALPSRSAEAASD